MVKYCLKYKAAKAVTFFKVTYLEVILDLYRLREVLNGGACLIYFSARLVQDNRQFNI